MAVRERVRMRGAGEDVARVDVRDVVSMYLQRVPGRSPVHRRGVHQPMGVRVGDSEW
jgi:hypothetical protein